MVMTCTVGGAALYDYPHLGVWPDAYYMSMNVFNTSGTAYLGPQAYRLRSRENGRRKPRRGNDHLMPRLGSANPPCCQPTLMARRCRQQAHRTRSFCSRTLARIGSITSTWISPSRPTPLSRSSDRRPRRALLNSLTLRSTAASANSLGNLADRLMFRLAYRNFGDQNLWSAILP